MAKRGRRNTLKKRRADNPRAATSLNDLPNELISQIFHFLVDDDDYTTPDFRTYLSLSWTSRRFHQIIQPYLYRSYRHISGERSSLFLRSLCENPTLASFVKEVRTGLNTCPCLRSVQRRQASGLRASRCLDYSDKLHQYIYDYLYLFHTGRITECFSLFRAGRITECLSLLSAVRVTEYLSLLRTLRITRANKGTLSEEAELCAILWQLPDLELLHWGDPISIWDWCHETQNMSDIWPYDGMLLGSLGKCAKLPRPAPLERHFMSLKKLRVVMTNSDSVPLPPSQLVPVLRLPSLKVLELTKLTALEPVPEWETIKNSSTIERLTIWQGALVATPLAQLICTFQGLRNFDYEVREVEDVLSEEQRDNRGQHSPVAVALRCHCKSLETLVLYAGLGSCLGSLKEFQSLFFLSIHFEALCGFPAHGMPPLHGLLPRKLQFLRITTSEDTIDDLSAHLSALSTRVKAEFPLLCDIMITVEGEEPSGHYKLRESFKHASIMFSTAIKGTLNRTDSPIYSTDKCLCV